MGLDWTIVFDGKDTEKPDRAHRTTALDAIEDEDYAASPSCSPEQVQASDYDKPWAFRAQELILIDELSDEVEADFFRDMAPPQMTALARALDREAERLEDTVSDHEAGVLTDARDWLSYWADEECRVIAYY